MLRLMTLLVITTGTAFAQSTAPPLPTGLWQAKDQSFVVRISDCNGGFCGVVAAGTPPGTKNPQDSCGKPIFLNFNWNQASGKWDGQMQPPGKDRTSNSQIDTDGKTFLALHAHMGIISRTMSFTPYTGKIGDGCQQVP